MLPRVGLSCWEGVLGCRFNCVWCSISTAFVFLSDPVLLLHVGCTPRQRCMAHLPLPMYPHLHPCGVCCKRAPCCYVCSSASPVWPAVQVYGGARMQPVLQHTLRPSSQGAGMSRTHSKQLSCAASSMRRHSAMHQQTHSASSNCASCCALLGAQTIPPLPCGVHNAER